MIPADRIAINGNEAWCLENDWLFGTPVEEAMRRLDRPCDTCQGTKVLGASWGEHMKDVPCPPCDGTGRHTFEIEVAVQYDDLENAWIGGKRAPQYDHVGSESSRITSAPLTVSVVPGLVLPIAERDDTSTTKFVFVNEVGDAYLYDPAERINLFVGTLPDDAKPGDWAVQLLIHETSNR